MYTIAFLDAAELAHLQRAIAEVPFVDGRATATGAAAAVKHNAQALKDDPRAHALLMRVHGLLTQNNMLGAIAYPKHIRNLMINRYAAGDSYDWHIDRSLMGSAPNSVRTDLSFTLFLSAPSDYEGGELLIDTEIGQRSAKLEAGQMIVYPGHYLHRVNEITSGVRVCAVGWIESWVADPVFRDTLWRLRRYMQETRQAATPAQVNAISEVYERLVKLASR